MWFPLLIFNLIFVVAVFVAIDLAISLFCSSPRADRGIVNLDRSFHTTSYLDSFLAYHFSIYLYTFQHTTRSFPYLAIPTFLLVIGLGYGLSVDFQRIEIEHSICYFPRKSCHTDR